MLEKKIILENVSLLDFLGPQNQNINAIASMFPQVKIVARGEKVTIKGNDTDTLKVNKLFNKLLEHYERYGALNPDNLKHFLNANKKDQYNPDSQDTIVYGVSGKPIRPRTQNQKTLVDQVKKNDLVFALGPAGTGKTFIAVALAVKALKNREVKKIIITRPAVEAGENLGFLPGDLQEKIDPYLRPIYDSLADLIPAEKLRYYQENQIIEIAPLAYMRGRTLKDAFVLLDEAQNTTPMQIKMFLTRMGPNSKVVVNGDESQVDLPGRQHSGLTEATRILKDVKGIGVAVLDSQDVIRHKLVKDIINAYEAADEAL
ncbi:PhoH family protein [Fulvitalea axinellae]|uniref:PhoH family protein n=1 Tax=Fulvitalea axinellae TaxID=1182444 RepID=UPI0030CA5354